MSATITWRPVTPPKGTIDTSLPNSFLETMELLFGKPPFTVSTNDLPKLEGMSAVMSKGQCPENPYGRIIKILRQYGAIEIDATY